MNGKTALGCLTCIAMLCSIPIIIGSVLLLYYGGKDINQYRFTDNTDCKIMSIQPCREFSEGWQFSYQAMTNLGQCDWYGPIYHDENSCQEYIFDLNSTVSCSISSHHCNYPVDKTKLLISGIVMIIFGGSFSTTALTCCCFWLFSIMCKIPCDDDQCLP